MSDRHQPIGPLVVRALAPVLILGVGVAAFVLLPMFFGAKPDERDQEPIPLTVRTAVVEAYQGDVPIDADGVVVPYREIELSAEVSGKIVERTEICRAGNYVTRGTLLVKIDPRDYELEVERLGNEVQQATVALDELAEEVVGTESLIKIAEQQIALRARELKRMRSLGRSVTSTDLERAEVNELQARNSLTTLRNRVRLLNIGRGRLQSARDLSVSNLKKAKLELSRTEIIAPVDGVIVAGEVEEDVFVQRGARLVVLEDTSKVEVKCKLEMKDLYWLWDQQLAPKEPASSVPHSETDRSSVAQAYDIPETPVKVIYRMAGRDDLEFEWPGRLSRYDGIGLDEKTRTVPCRVVVDDPLQASYRGGPPALVRGMYVTVRIEVKRTATRLFRVPEQALRPGNVVRRWSGGKLDKVGVHFVTLIDQGADGKSALVYVDPKQSETGATARELEVGDEVVISPLTPAHLAEGVLIEKTGEE